MWLSHRGVLIRRLSLDFQHMDYVLIIVSSIYKKKFLELNKFFFLFTVFGKSGDLFEVKPDIVSTFLKLLDCFMLVVTCKGNIVLAEEIENHLGHMSVSVIAFFCIFAS